MNKKKQILIVEDNEINQEIISSILENDFNVLKAKDIVDLKDDTKFDKEVLLTNAESSVNLIAL